MLQQFISVTLIASMAATPVVSQGIGANQSIRGGTVQSKPATPVLVATPYPGNAADSVSAVAIGNAMRERLQHNIGGGTWEVVPQSKMNSSLVQWGYGPDQLLPPDAARQMASSMSARMIVMTTINKESGGDFAAVVRVIGIADDAGQTIKASQAAGQSLADFGSKLADQVAVVFKAYPDAKACNDQLTVNPDKAADAANKALKTIPDYGFAEYCLGEVGQLKDSTGAATLQHFRKSLSGDPMSLRTLSQLAIIDQKKGDSNAVVADYQQMITIAPTNQKIAQDAINVFKQYNHPEAADQIVDQQLKIDPTNPDWHELKGNSCAYQAATGSDPAEVKAKFQCAYDAFGQVYSLDANRADSLFFQKIIFVAPTPKDSLEWAGKYVQKFPTSTTALETEASLLGAAGMTDSAVNVATLLYKLDSTETKPMLAVTIQLLAAKNDSGALKFVPLIQKADDQTRDQYAGILVQFADSASQRAFDSTKYTPRDDSLMMRLGQGVLTVNPTNHQLVELANYYLAHGMQSGFIRLSSSVRADKSCDEVKQYADFLGRFQSYLAAIVGASNAGVAAYGKQLQGYAQSEVANIPALQKA
ncbi:MAG: hypothetical protein ACREL5_04150, partial [Gemmatimonadales bacterium]